MSPVQHITCANRNTSGTIVRLGGEGWSLSRHEAIVGLMTDRFQLRLWLGNDEYVVGVRGDSSDAYLVLEPDARPLHTITGLPSC